MTDPHSRKHSSRREVTSTREQGNHNSRNVPQSRLKKHHNREPRQRIRSSGDKLLHMLPNEVLSKIIWCLKDDKDSLLSLSRVSCRIRSQCMPVLFRRIILAAEEVDEFLGLIIAAPSGGDIAASIRTLEINNISSRPECASVRRGLEKFLFKPFVSLETVILLAKEYVPSCVDRMLPSQLLYSRPKSPRLKEIKLGFMAGKRSSDLFLLSKFSTVPIPDVKYSLLLSEMSIIDSGYGNESSSDRGSQTSESGSLTSESGSGSGSSRASNRGSRSGSSRRGSESGDSISGVVSPSNLESTRVLSMTSGSNSAEAGVSRLSHLVVIDCQWQYTKSFDMLCLDELDITLGNCLFAHSERFEEMMRRPPTLHLRLCVKSSRLLADHRHPWPDCTRLESFEISGYTLPPPIDYLRRISGIAASDTKVNRSYKIDLAMSNDNPWKEEAERLVELYRYDEHVHIEISEPQQSP